MTLFYYFRECFYEILFSLCSKHHISWESANKEEKGVRLGYTLISNHAFVDGNKRIGMHIMLTFLEVNGIHMNCSNEDVIHAGLSVADGSMKYEGLLAWVREHESL